MTSDPAVPSDIAFISGTTDPESELLNRAFFALSDPVRRAILERLRQSPSLVSELAAPFNISLQAVSRHIQVLVRAGLVQQERTGRISTCSLDMGPLFAAAVWLNQYSHYWQAQFDHLVEALGEIELQRPAKEKTGKKKKKKKKKKAKNQTDALPEPDEDGHDRS